jgi:hypothetical protein
MRIIYKAVGDDEKNLNAPIRAIGFDSLQNLDETVTQHRSNEKHCNRHDVSPRIIFVTQRNRKYIIPKDDSQRLKSATRLMGASIRRRCKINGYRIFYCSCDGHYAGEGRLAQRWVHRPCVGSKYLPKFLSSFITAISFPKNRWQIQGKMEGALVLR